MCKPSPFTILFLGFLPVLIRNHLLFYNRNSHYVAVKTAEESIDSSELFILRYLNQQGGSDPMSTHVTPLVDCLEHEGPNGKHL